MHPDLAAALRRHNRLAKQLLESSRDIELLLHKLDEGMLAVERDGIDGDTCESSCESSACESEDDDKIVLQWCCQCKASYPTDCFNDGERDLPEGQRACAMHAKKSRVVEDSE